MIRAFIAVELAPAAIANIASAIAELKPALPAVRWVAPANFHLTVKFLGDIEASQIDAIATTLEPVVTLFPRCTINAKGLGVFPTVRQPKIFWVGIVGAELARLAATVDRALLPLGFSVEAREFTPHLTIGRWRQGEPKVSNLKVLLDRWREHNFGAMTIDRVILFHSELKPAGAVYTQLKLFKLNDQPID